MAVRPARRLSPGRAATTAAAWALGVALGVALGGWITVTSGSGAPGAIALDVNRDLLLIPALAGLAVFLVLFVAGLLLQFVRALRAAPHDDDRQNEDVEGEREPIRG